MSCREVATSFAAALAYSCVLVACIGTTGNELVHFRAAAAGPRDASRPIGAAVTFESGLGYRVTLTKAIVHVGAIYLVETLPSSGGGPARCFLDGTYVGEAVTAKGRARAGIDVDTLSSEPQYFPDLAIGTDKQARAAQVWLTGGPIDTAEDSTPIVQLEGVAEKDGATFPFTGHVTIGSNRLVKSSDSAKPGANPICGERIVSPLLVDIRPRDGGTLLLRIDPTRLFVDIDFAQLKKIGESPPAYGFIDSSEDAESHILYSTLHSAGSLYEFEWF